MGGSPSQRAGAHPRRGPRSQGALTLPGRLCARLEKELAGGAGLILILDYDGTLTPIVPSPGAARLAPTVRKTLDGLAKNPRVGLAVLSGRSLRDIKTRVGVANVVYGGCHGLEIEGAGVRFRHRRAAARSPRLSRTARTLARDLRRFPGAFLELKGLAVSVHYRQVAWRRRAELLDLAARVERQTPGVTSLPGKDVFEFLPQVHWGKGKAAVWITRQLGRKLGGRRAVVLYAGDDATDEPAFTALKGRALTVRVGVGAGLAEYAVESVSAIHALLRRIARAMRLSE
ncbi:MAG: trehalose-phosphatase [Candidatus Rokubacteria bacterium]|nr:trehalose-phosphatase [Candidatus Rokubacteria bacterium]